MVACARKIEPAGSNIRNTVFRASPHCQYYLTRQYRAESFLCWLGVKLHGEQGGSLFTRSQKSRADFPFPLIAFLWVIGSERVNQNRGKPFQRGSVITVMGKEEWHEAWNKSSVLQTCKENLGPDNINALSAYFLQCEMGSFPSAYLKILRYFLGYFQTEA